ncbi:MAG: cation:proton antiporter [Planctomycetota bacterium]|nr:cation:proton antiporter [Planctomycetota bacterium]
MELFYILLVLLVLTRAFGALAVRVGQPELVGQLISGIVLGAVVAQFSGRLPVLSTLTDDEVFVALTELGVFFLMLLGGVEMHPGKLVRASRRAVFVAAGGMIVPLAAGVLLGWLVIPASPYRPAQMLFLGTALAITAVPVAVKILLDLGRLDSRTGQTVVSAAIIDDILSLILLAVLTAIVRRGEAPGLVQLLLLGGKITAFLIFVVLAGRYVGPRIGALLKRSHLEEQELTALLAGACAFAVAAELLGMHFVLGAFAAGLFFGRQVVDESVYRDVKQKVAAITTAFLAPLFFASIGLRLDVTAMSAVPWFVILLIVIAFFGKLLGAGVVAGVTGLTVRESTAVGFSMSVRGAVELIIAGIALDAGLFDHPEPRPPVIRHMFSSVVIMAVATTLLAPIVLRYLLADRRGDGAGREGADQE